MYTFARISNVIPMSDSKTKIRQLGNKVEKLVNLHEQVLGENKKLKLVQNQLTEEVSRCLQKIAELEEQNKMIKLAQAVSGSDQNTRDIKLKINEYIREIDKCLALINR
jgi:DNA-binding transcriptional MerR regulator